MKSWVLATAVIVVIAFAGLAGYFTGISSVAAPTTHSTTVYSTTTTTFTTKVNQTVGILNSGDRFAISSVRLFFAPVQGCSFCGEHGNVSIAISNTGSTPITGVNMSFGENFLGLNWSTSAASTPAFPLLAGDSIMGFDGNSEVTNESNVFLVTAIFADGNATTESYDWPGGREAVVRIQPYCCLDPNFNASSSCRMEFNSTIYNTLEALVTANPEFIALENGKNFT